MFILVWLKCKNVSNSKYMDIILMLIQWWLLLNTFTINNGTDSFQSYYHKLMLKRFLLQKKNIYTVHIPEDNRAASIKLWKEGHISQLEW